MRYIEYYNKHINEQGFEKALDEYWEHMKKENIEIELTEDEWNNTSFDDLNDAVISHVLYHAEMNDFEPEEYMI